MSRRLGPVQRGAALCIGAIVLFGVVLGPFLDSAPGGEGFALLGRDHLGRDIALRLLGGTTAIALPFCLALAVNALAVGLGALTSWVGGLPRALVRGGVGVLAAIPRFIWVLLALSVYGRSPAVLGVGMGIAFIPSVYAVLDGRIAGWRRDSSIQAELAHGVPAWSVLWERLVLWDCGPPLLRQGLAMFGYAVALEATLAYLGFTVGEPRPSWGNAVAFDWGHSEVSVVARMAPMLAIWGSCLLATVATLPGESR